MVGVERVIEMIRNSSIVEDCYQIAADFCAQACLALDGMPDNACRKSLFDLSDYVIERHK